MAGVIFAPSDRSKGAVGERLGFGSSARRSSSLCPPSASQTVVSESGVARLSLIRSVSQSLPLDNGLGEAKARMNEDHDRCYSNALVEGARSPTSAVFSTLGGMSLHSSQHQTMRLSLTAAHHGTAADRNPSCALPSPAAHVWYSPATCAAPHSSLRNSRPLSAQSITSAAAATATGITSRPCSSSRMRDMWKMPFAPSEERPVPSSVFTAAPNTVTRETFLYQEYTKKSNLLMRPSSGDTRKDAQYLPVTYLKEGVKSSPSVASASRKFGDIATYNQRMLPRPSSCTYRPQQLRPTASATADGPRLPSRTSTPSSASHRECRCASRSTNVSTPPPADE